MSTLVYNYFSALTSELLVSTWLLFKCVFCQRNTGQ